MRLTRTWLAVGGALLLAGASVAAQAPANGSRIKISKDGTAAVKTTTSATPSVTTPRTDSIPMSQPTQTMPAFSVSAYSNATEANLIAHLASGGAVVRPGDLFGTGTISGGTPESGGSLMEMGRPFL